MIADKTCVTVYSAHTTYVQERAWKSFSLSAIKSNLGVLSQLSPRKTALKSAYSSNCFHPIQNTNKTCLLFDNRTLSFFPH